jgi:hypothetical protein
MPLFPVEVPEDGRIVGIGEADHAKLGGSPLERIMGFGGGGAGHCEPGKIALHVRHEDGHSGR